MIPDHLLGLIDILLLSFLVITALAVVLFRNLLVSTILLSIFSLLMAAMYLVMHAPDVAMTEAAVGAGISTLLFLAALLLTGTEEKRSEHPVLPLLVILITSGALVYASLGLPGYGTPDAPAHTHVARYYLEQTGTEIGIPNTVTAILASYRGFDTLGEVMVVFTAGIAVLLLLGRRRSG
ncbi:MAG: DUF4040 domain-containing protein [Hyphomicrobiales bacterium]|nr:DUF4040 domain-containing protein [Rickettsiales bacterium]MCP5361441.1 DUF4040 domain-containing protein [Hyphomicrobiales bacterium]